MVGVAERLDAFALELGCDAAEIDSGGSSVRQRALSAGRVRFQRGLDLAVVGECARVCSGIVFTTSGPISSET